MRAAKSSAAELGHELLELAGPQIEFAGFVLDLRPRLAAAAAVIVPLSFGGGTRLKIQAMAMGKAIVSTTLGAEEIAAVPNRDILVEDEPTSFANAVNHLCKSFRCGRHWSIGAASCDQALRLERSGKDARELLLQRLGNWLMKAALIGAGQIARQHLACLRTLPSVELVAVCDLRELLLRPLPSVMAYLPWFIDHREMLDKTRPDVVHVTTPPNSHFRLALDSLEAGAMSSWKSLRTSTLQELETLTGIRENWSSHC